MPPTSTAPGNDRPPRRLVERPQRAVAGEDAEVGAARRDRLARGDDEAPAVATPAQRLVGGDRAQPARGVAHAGVLDLLREDVERGQHAAVRDQGHRDRAQRGIVPRGANGRARSAGPRLLVERTDLLEQRVREIVLRVDADHGFGGHGGRLLTRRRRLCAGTTHAVASAGRALASLRRRLRAQHRRPRGLLGRGCACHRLARSARASARPRRAARSPAGSRAPSSTRATTRSTAMPTAAAATSPR